MKNLILILVVVLTGCVRLEHKQTMHKSTVFGLKGSTPDPSGSGMGTTLSIGLIRDLWVSNPVYTNEAHAAPIGSSVIADVTAIHQRADESFSFGVPLPPTPLLTNNPVSAVPSQIPVPIEVPQMEMPIPSTLK